ncbi:peptidoglycan recognition protein family protein [Streptomyces phytophilus]|uniref:peptidoglycan recognition protein family protein n=1 Tax=Streptomyces phytophilus TaxID=722715 RepID=UPI0015F0FF01|nr:peptidoglycan recognition family protein [Streptomyces phytophilus]
MKLVSRSAWGARAYRLPSGAIQYAGPRRGVKIHYLGGAYTDREHSRCDDYVRSVQSLHMDTNGWSDIGYSYVVCTHGYVYEGRGLRRRNSANGTTSLNEAHYAVLGLVGTSGVTTPPDAQLHGLRDAIEYCRSEGPAGSEIKGHRDGYATSCPGPVLYAWVQKGAPRPEEDEVTNDDIERIADAVFKKLISTDGVFEAPEDAESYKTNRFWTWKSHVATQTRAARGARRASESADSKLDQVLALLRGK